MTSVTDPAASDEIRGRRAAARAAADLLGVAPESIEVRRAHDGAPEAWIGDEPAAVVVSISHRHGRALAAAVPAGARVGCDLERVEVRHRGLGPRLGLADGAGDEQVTLAWAAREALAKARREPVGLDARVDVAVSADAGDDGWAPLGVGAGWYGQWRRDGVFVAVVVTDQG